MKPLGWVVDGRQVKLAEGRSDLGPIELARLLADAMHREGLTTGQLARRVGRSQPWVSNMISLLRLDPEVQRMVRDGALGFSQARALTRLPPASQVRLARRAVREGHSAHRVEAAAARSRADTAR